MRHTPTISGDVIEQAARGVDRLMERVSVILKKHMPRRPKAPPRPRLARTA